MSTETAAAVEVQAQYILCDMAGRVVVGGPAPGWRT